MPVLSVQMREHAPKVSITSNFLTKTFCSAIFSAIIYRHAVTVVGKPWGMLATIIAEMEY